MKSFECPFDFAPALRPPRLILTTQEWYITELIRNVEKYPANEAIKLYMENNPKN